jgi:hypothetical protein
MGMANGYSVEPAALLAIPKHMIAIAVNVIGFTAVCTISYLLLLLFAILFSGGLGSPLMIFLVPVGSMALSLFWSIFFLAPATMTAEFLCRRGRELGLLLQIPISSALLFILAYGASALAQLFRSQPFDPLIATASAATSWLLLAVPLGIYWWTLKSCDGVIFLATKLWKMLVNA